MDWQEILTNSISGIAAILGAIIGVVGALATLRFQKHEALRQDRRNVASKISSLLSKNYQNFSTTNSAIMVGATRDDVMKEFKKIAEPLQELTEFFQENKIFLPEAVAKQGEKLMGLYIQLELNNRLTLLQNSSLHGVVESDKNRAKNDWSKGYLEAEKLRKEFDSSLRKVLEGKIK